MRGFIQPPRRRKPRYCKTCRKIYLRSRVLPIANVAETHVTQVRHICLPREGWRALCGIDTSSHRWRSVTRGVLRRRELEA